MDNNTPLIRDLSVNLLDTVKTNKDRFDTLRCEMNRNAATVLLSIGLHFDQRVGQAFPIICGSDWVDRDQAVQLLQEALTFLNSNPLDDDNGKV